MCLSSRLVCQVLVKFSASTVCIYLDEEELASKSQILSLKNELLCLFCFVNKSLYNFCFSLAFFALLVLVCKHVLTVNYCHPLEASCVITIITTRYLLARTANTTTTLKKSI